MRKARPRPGGWALFAMLGGSVGSMLLVTWILSDMLGNAMPNVSDDITLGIAIAFGMGAGFLAVVLIGEMTGTRPAFLGGRSLGENITEFATAEPAPDKITLQGLGWLLLFFAGQVVLGGVVYVTSVSMAQAAVFDWRYGSVMPYVVAAVPTALVVALLEYCCFKIAGQGPITVIVVLGFAILLSA